MELATSNMNLPDLKVGVSSSLFREKRIKYSQENPSTKAKDVPGPRGRSRWVTWGGLTIFSLASLLTFGCGNQVIAKSTPTPSPTPTPEAAATPVSNLRTYTWKGTNIDVTTKCSPGDQTFDIEVQGNVTAGQGNGIWTTLSGEGKTIIVSYNAGDGLSPSRVAFSFNNLVTSIRREPAIALQTSGARTYGYEIKAYGAPQTDDKPTLSEPIGEASFATDCR